MFHPTIQLSWKGMCLDKGHYDFHQNYPTVIVEKTMCFMFVKTSVLCTRPSKRKQLKQAAAKVKFDTLLVNGECF